MSFLVHLLIILFGSLQFKGNEDPEREDDDGGDDVGGQGSPPDP